MTTTLSPLLQSFFTERLMKQRQTSPHTIASYRDTFRLLLAFAEEHLNKPPSKLTLDDLNAPFIGNFLNHIENGRHNGARTRNLRLTAIRSFFHYAAFQEPDRSALIQRVLAIPSKRHERPLIDFLTHPEILALLAAPDSTTWTGRRDRALLMLAIQTGLRLSELIRLRRCDIALGSGAHVRCYGKGRIGERCRLSQCPGTQLSPDGVQYLLAKHVAQAQKICPSLKEKRVSPHVLRHTAATELLQSGVDHSVTALWLAHESPETTHI